MKLLFLEQDFGTIRNIGILILVTNVTEHTNNRA